MMAGGRGLSDVVAFTLMFAIIIASVATVSTVGVDSLLELRDTEDINSAERAMQGFAASVDDIQRHGDPIRRFDFSRSNSGIGPASSELNISYSGGWNESVRVNALYHKLSGNAGTVVLVYEGGGVFRSDGGSATYDPQLRCDPSSGTAIVSVLNITFDESFTYEGTGGGSLSLEGIKISDSLPPDSEQPRSLEVTLVSSDVETLTSNTSGDVTLNVSQTFAPEQWQGHLENMDDWTKVDDHKFRCGDSIDSVLVRVTTVKIRELEEG